MSLSLFVLLILTLRAHGQASNAYFSVSAGSPPSLAISQGASATATVTVTSNGGYHGGVFVSTLGLPSGVIASFSPNFVHTGPTDRLSPHNGQGLVVLSSGTATDTVTLSVSSSTLAGSYPLDVHVEAFAPNSPRPASADTPFTLTINPPPTYQLSSYPTRLTLVQGSSNAATVSVLPFGTFSGSVTLTNSALPSGVTLAYGTNPTTGTSMLTFTATATAALGQSSVTITGTSGNLVNSVNLPLTVAPVVSGSSSNVTLAFSTGEVGLTAGSAAGGSASLAVTPVNGYTGPVSFAATGLPSGVSVVTNPTALSITGTGAQTTQVTFQATSAVTPGYYPVAVTGSGNGGATSTAVVGLNILPPPNSLPFTLTVTDDTTNALPTGIASAVVSLATTGGYANPIALSLIDDPVAPVLAAATTTDPTKIGVSFSQTSLSGSGTSALTLTVGASVAPGAYHFVVSGLSTDSSAQNAAFTVFVAPENLATDPNIDGSLPSQTYTGDNPSYPLAAGIGDMERFDFDPASTFEIGSRSHIVVGALAPVQLAPRAPIGNAGIPDGTDDRIYMASKLLLPYTFPYSACVRISAIWSDGSRKVGSGTIIGNNHILTAAHVVFDPAHGGMATTIYVRPGFDYNWAQTHSAVYTTAKHTFVAKGYLKAATFTNITRLATLYDDWAVIDCNPIINGPQGKRGGSIGSYAGHMDLESVENMYFPETSTHIAGYPGFTWAPATPVLTGALSNLCPDLFETSTYNGDDGAVDLSPDPDLFPDSATFLFSSMDISHGDSGAGLMYIGDDAHYHVYGVVESIVPWSGLAGLRSGFTGVHTQITGIRYSIIKTHEKSDGDEPPAVYTP